MSVEPDDERANLVQSFFTAIKQGNIPAVRALIEQDPALVGESDPQEFGAPPLNLAVSRGNRAMCDLLLEAGAEINRKSDWWAGGFAPIHAALWRPGAPMAEYLIERGALVDAHAAAGLGRLDWLAELLSANPELVHARGGDGQFPLHYSATPEIVDFLLARGADLEARDIDHESTAAQWAIKDRPAVVRRLIERGARPDIFMLCAIGDTGGVRAMLEEQPTRVAERITRETFPVRGSEALNIYAYIIGENAMPLHAAALLGNAETIEALLDAGAEINATGAYDDSTALHMAAWSNRVEPARCLIERGADINQKSGAIHRNTPLGWAVVAGAVEMVAFLLEAGAKIEPWHLENAQAGERGEFAAFTTAEAGRWTAIAELLRGWGAGG